MSSERATLLLYLGEIVDVINEEIMSSSWARIFYEQAAQAVSKLSEVLGESLSSHHHILLISLMKEVPGRLWEGKDVLLNALSALCTACPKAISIADHHAPTAILNIILLACSKKVKKYREAAFCCLEQGRVGSKFGLILLGFVLNSNVCLKGWIIDGEMGYGVRESDKEIALRADEHFWQTVCKMIKAFHNPEFFNMVFLSLFEICNTETHVRPNRIPSETDAEAEADEKETLSAANGRIVSCLTAIIHVANIRDILHQQRQLVNMFLYFLSPSTAWAELSSKLHHIPTDSQDLLSLRGSAIALFHELVHTVLPRVVECMKTIKIGQVHISASECLLEVIDMYKTTYPEQSSEVAFIADLLHLYDVEKNEQAKFLLGRCIDILQNLGKQSKSLS
ncbi:hypothetical protein M9H77_17655 [Catharanthus roseus]|uniref:Uncharacterized protein n=1 Tax=Catharanthus roseus TaxID=4058 RepID=A0ACC0B576_CATRO|nr:hypothetical protein M9H77_17655 [Catharanthus roseus]